AGDADQMVVMAGLARDEAPAVEPAHAAVGLARGERPVDGRQADRATGLARGGPELLGGERVLLLRDELGQQRPLARGSHVPTLLQTRLIITKSPRASVSCATIRPCTGGCSSGCSPPSQRPFSPPPRSAGLTRVGTCSGPVVD